MCPLLHLRSLSLSANCWAWWFRVQSSVGRLLSFHPAIKKILFLVWLPIATDNIHLAKLTQNISLFFWLGSSGEWRDPVDKWRAQAWGFLRRWSRSEIHEGGAQCRRQIPTQIQSACQCQPWHHRCYLSTWASHCDCAQNPTSSFAKTQEFRHSCHLRRCCIQTWWTIAATTKQTSFSSLGNKRV